MATAQLRAVETARDVQTGSALLLVEDDRINQMIASALLESDGYRVTIANDGLEALEKAALHRFDAILMDVVMPQLDGIGTTHRLRTEEGPNRTTPILALTANTKPGDRERYLAAGMNDCLAKPFDLAMVRMVLARWIDNGSGVPEAPHTSGDVVAVPILDESRLTGLEARIAGPKFAAMVRAFIDNADQRLERIAESHATGDQVSLEREAHSLAGAASNVGALQLAAAAHRVEAACGTPDAAKHDVLMREIAELRPALAAARQALSARFLRAASAVPGAI